MRIGRFLSLLLVLSAFSAVDGPEAQEDGDTSVEWSALRWEVQGAVALEDYLGRPALRFGSGSASLVGELFENGIVEFDIAADGTRSFTGLAFRFGDTGYEHVYLRPHQTGRFDALQYTPDFHGLSAWQLFPEFNASTDIPRNAWLHVRIVVAGSKLTVFVGNGDKPALEVDPMRRGPGAGRLVLTSFVPQAPAGMLPNAYSNFTVARSTRPVEWKQVAAPAGDSGFVREWSVSNPIPGPERPIEAVAADTLAGLTWSRLAADDTGRVNLARLAGRPGDGPRGMVFARVRVRSDKDQVKRMDFGFSDQATIVVNGEVLFTGNNTYRSRSQRYLGVMTIDNDALRIPLKQGDNEVLFAVIESFGGWGLTARFPDSTGLTVQAP